MDKLGPLNSKIWIIDSNPKRGAVQGPMSSPVGMNFVNSLRRNGLHLDEIHFDYLVNKVPPNGKQKNGIEHFRQIGQLDNEVALLKARIQEYKPNLVLGLGSDVLRELLGQKALLKWRGHVVWSDELGCKIMITINPYHAHSQKQIDKAQKPGQYQALLNADIQKALVELETPVMLHAEPDLIIAPSYDKTVSILQGMLDNAKIISYDIEVFKPYVGRLMDCIGLCDNMNSAICIPFYMSNVENTVDRYFRDLDEYTHVLSLIKQIMESNIPKVAQNSSFDTTMLLKYYGIKCNNVV